jgi:hypothetical protein
MRHLHGAKLGKAKTTGSADQISTDSKRRILAKQTQPADLDGRGSDFVETNPTKS